MQNSLSQNALSIPDDSNMKCIGYDILTTVIMKGTSFKDVTPCILVEVR
jgi:hypothetical protein